jgi:hypothetical protein
MSTKEDLNGMNPDPNAADSIAGFELQNPFGQ